MSTIVVALRHDIVSVSVCDACPGRPIQACLVRSTVIAIVLALSDIRLTNPMFSRWFRYLDCESYNGVWMRSLTTNIPCSETTRITLRPCCIGHKSECQLLTESQCEFEAGLWHEDKLLCSQVPCLKETCGASITGKDKPTQNEIEPPNQWLVYFMHAVGGIGYCLHTL